jgi:hypothetical protein
MRNKDSGISIKLQVKNIRRKCKHNFNMLTQRDGEKHSVSKLAFLDFNCKESMNI